jgi:hypothetical protein
MNAYQLLAALALGVFLGLGSAHAQPVVYDSSVGPGRIKGLGYGGDLELYIDPGTVVTDNGGTVCEDGNGDELCAADVVIVVTGEAEITGFAPADGIIFEPYPDDVPPGTKTFSLKPGTKTLRLNLLQSISPPSPSPQPLGVVTVNVFPEANHTNPVKVVASGQAVDAGGTLIGIPSVVVPEPSVIVLLLSGALGLAALHWLRTRGSSVVASGGSQNSR